ncbi:MAG TPA: hypothetical protein VGW10_19790 [Solirubrobacteraceae bacterium]|nr:hypothetical protein [Solirubrobacteraceae bacterium]
MSLVRRRVLAGGLAALLAAGSGIAVAGGGSSEPGARGNDNPRCPRDAQRLPPDALAGATHAALAHARERFGAKHAPDIRAVAAALGPNAGRGGQVRYECGRRIQRRTVVVDLLYAQFLPSASLSQGTLAVSLIDGRYRVWLILH